MRPFLATLVVLAVALAAAGVYLVRRPFPETSGEVRLVGLHEPVEVLRDARGVPHVYASTSHDLFYVQGYLHAQDRFWQMDFWRHVGAGRTAELFGSSQAETDAFLRTLGWERLAREEWKRFDPESRALLTAYADGVNAWLEDRPATTLSLEHTVLRLTNRAYRPALWEPVHSLSWGKAMAWDLKANWEEELERAVLSATLPRDRIAQLFPPYPAEAPTIVPGEAQATRTEPAPEIPAEALPALRQAGERMALLDDLVGPLGEAVGSNSWVVGGERTRSGLPILANDPHLPIQMPSIWYQVGLHCAPRTDDCPYRVTGFSFAGVPGVIIGRNHRIAWGVTNLGADVMDLYLERVHPDDPDLYEADGEWVEMEVVPETVRVAGGEPIEVRARLTRHGPVVSDVHETIGAFEERSGLGLPDPYAVSLRWTALEPSNIFRSIWRINRAEGWEEFREALRDFDVPSQNFLYTDAEGNIGYQVPGKIPIREGWDGRWPVPGWSGEYEWAGYLPFEDLPSVLNPAQGYLVTANHAPVARGHPFFETGEWTRGYRAHRIIELIEAHQGPIGPEDVGRMQMDDENLNARNLLPYLEGLELSPELEEARDLLEAWDRRHGEDSAGAALFEAFWAHLLRETFWDEVAEEQRPEGFSRWFEVVRLLLERPDDPWWDDTGTVETETRDDVLVRALAGAWSELRTRLGDDPTAWRWGDLHTAVFRNQSLGESGIRPIEALFNRGGVPVSGTASVVDNVGWDAAEGYEVTWIPSMRMVVDFGDPEASGWVHSTGQSGHAFHPHYTDQLDPWREGVLHPMPFSRAQVEEEAVAVLWLVP